MMTLWIFQNFNSHWTNTITFTSKAFKFKMESYLFRPYTHRWYSTVQIFKIIYFITRQSIPEHKKYNKPYSKSVNFLLLWISNYRQSVIVIYSLLVYSHWIKYSQCWSCHCSMISQWLARPKKFRLFSVIVWMAYFSLCLVGNSYRDRIS